MVDWFHWIPNGGDGVVAYDREAEGGDMSPGDAKIYDCLGVDWFHWIPKGGNSIVAHDREAEDV